MFPNLVLVKKTKNFTQVKVISILSCLPNQNNSFQALRKSKTAYQKVIKLFCFAQKKSPFNVIERYWFQEHLAMPVII